MIDSCLVHKDTIKDCWLVIHTNKKDSFPMNCLKILFGCVESCLKSFCCVLHMYVAMSVDMNITVVGCAIMYTKIMSDNEISW